MPHCWKPLLKSKTDQERELTLWGFIMLHHPLRGAFDRSATLLQANQLKKKDLNANKWKRMDSLVTSLYEKKTVALAQRKEKWQRVNLKFDSYHVPFQPFSVGQHILRSSWWLQPTKGKNLVTFWSQRTLCFFFLYSWQTLCVDNLLQIVVWLNTWKELSCDNLSKCVLLQIHFWLDTWKNEFSSIWHVFCHP